MTQTSNANLVNNHTPQSAEMQQLAAFPRYEAYKDSGEDYSGEVPQEWELVPIRAIFDERNEKNIGPKTEHILSVTKDRGVIPYDEKGAIGNNKSDDIERYKIVHKNDLVINKMNVVIGSLGLSKYYGALSQVYIILKPKSPKFCISYFAYVFHNEPFYRSLIKFCTGIMELRESLDKEQFKKLYLPLPSLEEQTRIASYLDQKTAQIDQAIAIKEQQIALLKERKQIIIQQAVTQGLDPNVPMKDSGIDWIGQIPAHWKITKLGYISEIGNGSTPNRASSSFWKDGDIPWLNSSKINDEKIVEAEQFVTTTAVKHCHLPVVAPGSLLIAITGEGKTRGMVAVCMIKATINQHLAYITIRNRDVMPDFVLQYLRGMYDQVRAQSSGTGSTKGAITCGEIKNYFVPIPPLNEQATITSTIAKASDIFNSTERTIFQQIQSLKEYKTTLINNAVTGKIKITPEMLEA